MQHHFADFLDREGDYWHIVPNRERHAYLLPEQVADKAAITIATIQGTDSHWQQVFDLPNLEELTLHHPTKEQVAKLAQLKTLKRLRITKIQLKDIEVLGDLPELEELVLEYVSGFTDLSPLQRLTRLKSVHFENLRRVSNFDGLVGIDSLRFLYITGTLDWKQPIANVEFLRGLPNLEVLALIWVDCQQEFPMFLPALSLTRLKKVHFHRGIFALKEFIFWELAFPDVKGIKPELFLDIGGGFIDFLGKNSGYVKAGAKTQKQRQEAFLQTYETLKVEVAEFLATAQSSKP